MTDLRHNARTLLKEAREQLEKAGIATAALDARLLVCEALGVSQEHLLREPDQTVAGEKFTQLSAMVARRTRCEPMAYILGTREFWGRAFMVTPATLIPRPDTEIMIEAVLAHYDSTEAFRFLDAGTGSGCIAVTVAAEYPQASGIAVDVSQEALDIAHSNARAHGVEDRCAMVHSHWDEALPHDQTFDLILSNPPYIAESEREHLMSDVRDYEPSQALFATGNGLDAYRAIASFSLRRLNAGGMVMLEAGMGQAEAIKEIFANEGLVWRRSHADLQAIERVLVFANA